MKIHISKRGKIFVMLVFCAFLLSSLWLGWAILENYRVASVEQFPPDFQLGDIQYHDCKTLKESFRKRRDEVLNDLKRLEKLHEKYPNNKALHANLLNHRQYLRSMEKASFDCPKHSGEFVVCPECEGSGKKWHLIGCTRCNGHKHFPCSCCGHYEPSKISAKSLLK